MMKLRNITYALIYVFSLNLSTLAVADAIKIGVAQSTPPYFIKETGMGMELEILQTAFGVKGHLLEPYYTPFYRLPELFTSGNVDCVSTMTEASEVSAYYSEPVITQQIYAISMAHKNLRIFTVNDLANLRVIAFSGTVRYLGGEFASAMEKNPFYREKVKEIIQPLLLYRDRIDVAICDRRVFLYHRDQVKQKIDINSPLTFHNIFPPRSYKVACHVEQLRDDLNVGLKQIREDGTYDKIISRYESGIGGRAGYANRE